MKHELVQLRDFYCNLSLNLPTYVGNWFFHFLGHGSTQLLEYDLSLFSKHPVNGENKWRKLFLLLVKVLTVLFLFPLFLPSKKADHWLLVVSGTVTILKYIDNDGISLTY